MKDKKYYKNVQDKNGECSKRGLSAEEAFKALAEKRGYSIQDSTVAQNKRGKDVYITKDGVTISVDVKSQKKLSRRDKNTSDEWTCLELTNTHGNPGWLAPGKADFIAFEKPDCFVISKTVPLREWLVNESPAKESIASKDYVEYSRQAKYKIYRRSRFNRMDEMVYAKIEDISALDTSSIWEKTP